MHARPAPTLGDLPRVLERLWRRWALDPAQVTGLVLASRGIWTADERQAQECRLASLAARVRVIPDVEAAYLGALGARPGVLLVAGTGSIALGRDATGRWARAGGLGPLLGDEGSAFWLGREWLRSDAGAARFALARRILRSPDPVSRIAALAPTVIRRARAGERLAREIVIRAQDALAALLADVAGQLRLGSPVAVSWGGGLLADDRFRRAVWRTARRRGLEVDVITPREDATAAAARLAIAIASEPERGRAPHRVRSRRPFR